MRLPADAGKAALCEHRCDELVTFRYFSASGPCCLRRSGRVVGRGTVPVHGSAPEPARALARSAELVGETDEAVPGGQQEGNGGGDAPGCARLGVVHMTDHDGAVPGGGNGAEFSRTLNVSVSVMPPDDDGGIVSSV